MSIVYSVVHVLACLPLCARVAAYVHGGVQLYRLVDLVVVVVAAAVGRIEYPRIKNTKLQT
jgi:hypothetical protein